MVVCSHRMPWIEHVQPYALIPNAKFLLLVLVPRPAPSPGRCLMRDFHPIFFANELHNRLNSALRRVKGLSDLSVRECRPIYCTEHVPDRAIFEMTSDLEQLLFGWVLIQHLPRGFLPVTLQAKSSFLLIIPSRTALFSRLSLLLSSHCCWYLSQP